MRNNRPFVWFLLLALSFGLSQCRFRQNEWDVDMLVPIGYADLSVDDLIKSDKISQNPDSSLQFAYRLPLTDLTLGDLIHVPDTSFEKAFSLRTITLGQRQIVEEVTLGQVAKNAGPLGQLIIFNHGNSMAVPPLSNLSSPDVTLDASSFFTTATFIQGTLQLDINNGFPVNLTNVWFEIRNQGNNVIVVEDTIPLIAAAATETRSYSLNGKTVDGNLVARIVDMSTPGSGGNPVPIDTNDALRITVTAKDIKLFSAEAVFPAQDVINDSTDVLYHLGGAELTQMRVRTGEVRLTTYHTLPAESKIYYAIPGASYNGKPYEVYDTLPAAPPGDTMYITETYPIDNYLVDLRGQDGTKYNSIFNILRSSIDSTGDLIKLSLSDSIYIFYGLFGIVPEYVKGYLGSTTEMIGPEKYTTDALSLVKEGRVLLENIDVSLEVENTVGAPGTAELISLSAKNTRTGETRTLTGTVVGQEFQIGAATDAPLTPAYATLSMNASNSNIAELIEILPDEFTYSFRIQINPDPGAKDHNQFLYYDSKVKATLNIEMPLQFGLEGVVLSDTLTPDFSEVESELGQVKGGKLYLIAENGFPLSAELTAYVLNAAGDVVDSLTFAGENTIASAILNPDGRVQSAVESRLVAEMTDARWQLLQSGYKIAVRARLNTPSQPRTVKVYSDYFINLKLSTDVTYRTHF